MSDYTPDLHAVRGAYISWLPAMFTEERAAEFDRFINKVKADALRDAAWADEMPDTPAHWLIARADRIESGGGQ